MNLPPDSQNRYAAPSTVGMTPKPTSDIETLIRSLGVLQPTGGSLLTTAGVFLVFATILNFGDQPDELGAFAGILGTTNLAFGVFLLCVAVGLEKLSSPARFGATVYSALGLIGFPVGTLISGYFLYLLGCEKGLFVFTPEYLQIREQPLTSITRHRSLSRFC